MPTKDRVPPSPRRDNPKKRCVEADPQVQTATAHTRGASGTGKPVPRRKDIFKQPLKKKGESSIEISTGTRTDIAVAVADADVVAPADGPAAAAAAAATMPVAVADADVVAPADGPAAAAARTPVVVAAAAAAAAPADAATAAIVLVPKIPRLILKPPRAPASSVPSSVQAQPTHLPTPAASKETPRNATLFSVLAGYTMEPALVPDPSQTMTYDNQSGVAPPGAVGRTLSGVRLRCPPVSSFKL